jgi:hypothetical protein
LPFVRVTKEGASLKIGLEEGKSYELKTKLEAEIALPELTALDLSGAAQATLSGFKDEKELTLKMGGASRIGGSLVVASADFLAGGASSMALVGSAKSARIKIAGASHSKLGEFLLGQCEIAIEGASTAELAVRSSSPFKAEVTGASRLNGSIQAPRLELDLHGASHVGLGVPAKDASPEKSAGPVLEAERLKVVASGASHVDAARLVARDAEVELSGASHATVRATGSLSYDLSSASHLSYRGNPSSVTGKKSGGSSISHRQ